MIAVKHIHTVQYGTHMGRFMRKKTEVRREAILDAATQEFTERGYEGASMSAILGRIGGSKQTLYSYFPSKANLFVEVMLRIVNHHVAASYAEMTEETDLAQSLRRYGLHYLKVRQSPDLVGLVRLAYGEAGRSDVGRLLYQRGRMKGVHDVAAFLAAAMQDGRLREADATIAALHYFALLDAELADPVVLGVREQATDAEVAEIVGRSVDAFLAAYGRREADRPFAPTVREQPTDAEVAEIVDRSVGTFLAAYGPRETDRS